MATRWLTYPDAVDEADAKPLLRHLGSEVAVDMRRIVPVDTGALRDGIYVGEPDDTTIGVFSGRHVSSVSKRGGGRMDDPKVPLYVEKGTSKMKAQPYMRPSLYRYRAQ